MEFSPLEPRKIKPKSNGSDARSQKADGSKSKFSPGAGELRSHQRVNFTQLPYDGTGTQRPNVGSSDLIKIIAPKRTTSATSQCSRSRTRADELVAVC
jgi:hypothetical protein